MENPICDIKVLNNPNRKYASTVNIVFFRAYPLYKNFEIYIEGLKKWKEYKEYYPDCQLQLFIDQSIAEDNSIIPIINSLDARVFLVKCPDFVKQEKYHIGLFPTFWRFFPGFDIFKHPFKIAHSQELEPEGEDLEWTKRMNKIGKIKYPNLGFIHRTDKIFKFKLKSKFKIDGVLDYPQVFAGRIMFCTQAPFKLMVDFFNKVNRGENILKIYGNNKAKPEHKGYSFGVDETFLNIDYQNWIIENGFAIGIILHFIPAHPVYYQRERIMKDSKSKEIMNYILQKKISLSSSLDEFDKLYHEHSKNKEYVKECTDRFQEVVDKYPNWLDNKSTFLIQKVLRGFAMKHCLLIVRNNKIENIISLNIDQ